MTVPPLQPHAEKAFVPWAMLRSDVALLLGGVLVMAISYTVDSVAMRPDWFARSGAVAVLLSGILAYRSLTRHYRKFFNDSKRGNPLRTSRNQAVVDAAALGLSILGTVVWAYGDKIQ